MKYLLLIIAMVMSGCGSAVDKLIIENAKLNQSLGSCEHERFDLKMRQDKKINCVENFQHVDGKLYKRIK